jgi:hypothetical protein
MGGVKSETVAERSKANHLHGLLETAVPVPRCRFANITKTCGLLDRVTGLTCLQMATESFRYYRRRSVEYLASFSSKYQVIHVKGKC